jgi:amidase
LKTQRGRVPLAPHLGAWHGMGVNGVLTRSVHDCAFFHDAIAAGAPDPGAPVPPVSSFLDALGAQVSSSEETPRKLRIAVSSKLPPSPLTRLSPENRGAVDETAALLRRLGHQVDEREVDYGPTAPAPEFTALYLRGLHDEVASLAHPERVERRLRMLARLGGALAPGAVGWARAREPAYAARVSALLADHDVLLTPVTPARPPEIGAREGLGWLRTSLAASATVLYAAPWNLTGQPACSVPAGFASDGLPRAVQLVGRPNDEATLLALAAQLEAERPWAHRRPPGFS